MTADLTPEARLYLASLGRRGGKAAGKRKARGDSEYYRGLRKKRTEKEKKD